MLNTTLPRRVQAPQRDDLEADSVSGATSRPTADDQEPAEIQLDAAALARLAELDPDGSNRLVERILTTFIASAERLMPQLREAQRKQELGGVRHVAHTFKSSAASIGAVRLSQVCAEIETSIRTGATDGLEGRIERMEREMARVLRAIAGRSGAAT